MIVDVKEDTLARENFYFMTAEGVEKIFKLIKDGYKIVVTRWMKRGMLTSIFVSDEPAVFMGIQAPKPDLKPRGEYGLIVLKNFDQLDELQKFINAIRYRDWVLIDVKRKGNQITLTKIRRSEEVTDKKTQGRKHLTRVYFH